MTIALQLYKTGCLPVSLIVNTNAKQTLICINQTKIFLIPTNIKINLGNFFLVNIHSSRIFK